MTDFRLNHLSGVKIVKIGSAEYLMNVDSSAFKMVLAAFSNPKGRVCPGMAASSEGNSGLLPPSVLELDLPWLFEVDIKTI